MSLESRIDAFEKAFRTFEEFSQADLTQNMAQAAFVKAFEHNYDLASHMPIVHLKSILGSRASGDEKSLSDWDLC